MSRSESQPEAINSSNGKRVFGGEPFHPDAAHPDGSVEIPGDAYFSQARQLIKNRADCPHIAVIMPIGDKSYQVVEEKDGEKKVVNHYRQPGLVPIELMMNAQQVMQPLNVTLTWLTMKNDLSGRLREKMTEEAVSRGAAYIFYWDDDVLLPHNCWYRMLNYMNRYPDIGALTGVVWTKTVPTEPLLYKDAGMGAYWGFDRNPTAPPEDVYAAGAGCFMARVEAIQKMERPWWHDERSATDDGSYQGVIGHDLRFFRNMKKETGYRICVDGSIQCHHFDIEGQRVYHMPDDMPPVEEARRVADGYVNLERQEAVAPQTVEEIEGAIGSEQYELLGFGEASELPTGEHVSELPGDR